MNKKIGIGVLIFVIIVMIFFVFQSGVCSSDNKVSGTYREQYLEITLNNDNSFSFINNISGTSAKGNYTYNETDEKAIITLNVQSGNCSYNGGIVYFNLYGRCVFVPTINGAEVVARMMDKVK